MQHSWSTQLAVLSQMEHPRVTSTSSRNTTDAASWQLSSSPLSTIPLPLPKSPLWLATAFICCPCFQTLYKWNGTQYMLFSVWFLCSILRWRNSFIRLLGKVNFNYARKAGQVNRSFSESYWKSENNVFFFSFSNIKHSLLPHTLPPTYFFLNHSSS